MKTVFTLKLVLLFLCVITFPLKSQNPTYQSFIVNGDFISANEFEFDIYIRRDGPIQFEVYGLRHCLIFDNSVLNGGIPTLTYITGTSQMNSAQLPSNTFNLISTYNGKRVIKMPARTISTPGTGTIISDTGDGTRFGRFRLKTSASSFYTWYLNLDWNFNIAYGYTTQYYAYVNSFPVDITVHTNHINLLYNFPLFSIEYEARLMNDVQVSSNSYEFDIYLKDRSYAAHAVAYGIQICLLINDSINNNGILYSEYITGTSEMSPEQIPGNPDISSLVGGKRVWKLQPKKTNFNSSTRLSVSGIGTRLGRFKISTTAPSFAGFKPDIVWNFDTTYSFSTVIELYDIYRYWQFNATFPYWHLNFLSNPVLPVELISFQAAITNDNTVLLEWSTATETNNYGFEVQRKVLSQQSTVSSNEFEKIGFISGSGNSSTTKNYSYIDKHLSGGNKFAYRLKQIDNNGTFSYSSIQEVELILGEYMLSQNYPNPFNPTTMIEYTLPQAGNVLLTLYNLLGEKVEEIVNEFKESGIYTVDLDVSNLSSGSYIYVLRANGNTVSKKLTILK